MPKLKIITLTMQEYQVGDAMYRVFDEDGKLLASRQSCRSCKGTTFIAALVTKNTRGSFLYTIKSLFAEFHRISRKGATKIHKPYAIAIREDMKDAFEQWRIHKRKAKKAKPTIDDYAKPK